MSIYNDPALSVLNKIRHADSKSAYDTLSRNAKQMEGVGFSREEALERAAKEEASGGFKEFMKKILTGNPEARAANMNAKGFDQAQAAGRAKQKAAGETVDKVEAAQKNADDVQEALRQAQKEGKGPLRRFAIDHPRTTGAAKTTALGVTGAGALAGGAELFSGESPAHTSSKNPNQPLTTERSPEETARSVQQARGRHEEPYFSAVGGYSKQDKIRDAIEANNAAGARLRMADQQGQMDMLRARTVAGMRGQLPSAVYDDPKYAGTVRNADAARAAYDNFLLGGSSSGYGAGGGRSATENAKLEDAANAKIREENNAFLQRVRNLVPEGTDPRAVSTILASPAITALSENPEQVLQLIRAQEYLNKNYRPDEGYGVPDITRPGVLERIDGEFRRKDNTARMAYSTGKGDPTRWYQRLNAGLLGDQMRPYIDEENGQRGYLVGDTAPSVGAGADLRLVLDRMRTRPQ